MSVQEQDQDVSIAVANYNNSAFLKELFESVLASDILPYRFIVCDDGSTDGSQEIIARYVSQHYWIRAIYFEKNKGVAHATNAAIQEVKTKYVLRVDTDDILMPDRISTQAAYLREHKDIDVLGGNCTYFDSETGADMHNSSFPETAKEIEKLFHKGENGVLNGTTMFKRSCFDRFQYDQAMVWAEDYDLFASMLHGGCTFAGQAAPMTRVRIHRSSVTSNLQFDTLKKANDKCRELFGKAKSPSALNHYYQHLLHYRKYMMSTKSSERYYHLFMAVIHRPSSVLKRLMKK